MLRQSLGFLALMVLCRVPPCVAADPATAKKDTQNLEGTWNVVSIEMKDHKTVVRNGKLIVDGKPQNESPPLPVFVWKDGKGIYRIGDKEMPVLIDPTQTPKTLDVVMEMPGKNGPQKVIALTGIYRQNGDTLEILHAVPGKGSAKQMTRPKEFKVDASNSLMTLRRQKP